MADFSKIIKAGKGAVSRLIDEMRQTNPFEAKRLERMADEVPNLENLYKEEALKGLLRGDNAKGVMTMRPQDFEKFSTKLDFDPNAPQRFLFEPEGVPPNLTQGQYIKYLSDLQGFSDVPMLEVNTTPPRLKPAPFISGHEGRHRSRALVESGQPTSIVQFLPRFELREGLPRRSREEYLKALNEELERTNRMVRPQRLNPNERARPLMQLPEVYEDGGAVHMGKGGSLKGLALLEEMQAQARAGLNARKFTPVMLESQAQKLVDEVMASNPKLSPADALDKALIRAERNLAWEHEKKPELEKTYGKLRKASSDSSNLEKQQNVPAVVKERIRKANEFLDKPTEPWKPPPAELQAFDRSAIKDALEGFPGVEQSAFPRDIPAQASVSHAESLYKDPVNRELIIKQIKRGLPLGGESFYASLYPVKQAVLEAGMPAEKFDQWIHSIAPASARNSIMNEMAVGQLFRDMHARGIPLTAENVEKAKAEFKAKYGISLPAMPIHFEGAAKVLEQGQNLRDVNLANIPTNYKIPTYGSQKAGDFGKSVVLDVHEAAGETLGSKYHPYFTELGGFGNKEYNAGEQGMLGIAKELGIPGGMAQAGRWFGGGELTGLKSPRGDALDLLEKQVAYTLMQQGKQPNPAMIRKEVLRQIETGRGELLPWYKSEGMPDVRQTGLQRKEGGEVRQSLEDLIMSGQPISMQDFIRLHGEQEMAVGGPVTNTSDTRPDVSDGGQMISAPFYAEGGSTRKEWVPNFDQGGYAFQEPLAAPDAPVPDTTTKAVHNVAAKTKEELEELYRRMRDDPKFRRDVLARTGAQAAAWRGDIANLVASGVDYLQAQVPGLRKKESVLQDENYRAPAPYRTEPVEYTAKYPATALTQPFTSDAIINKMKETELIGENESPLLEVVGGVLTGMAGPKVAAATAKKVGPLAQQAAKSGARGFESKVLNEMVPNVRSTYTPLTATLEATAPDLGQQTTYGYRQGLNDRLLQDAKSIFQRPNVSREGYGTYRNLEGTLETNPLLAVDIPFAGSVGEKAAVPNREFRRQMAQLGVDLNQDAMAAHRFIPLTTNNVRDASAALIKTDEGLTKQQVTDLYERLGHKMAVSHNPRLGGIVVFPYEELPKGKISRELLRAQQAAEQVLGDRAKVQFGKSDYNRDRMYIPNTDYAKEGAVPISAEQERVRRALQGQQKFLFPKNTRGIPGEVQASPIGGLQPWSRGDFYPSHVIGVGDDWQAVNFLTGEKGKRRANFADADVDRQRLLEAWHRTLPMKVR